MRVLILTVLICLSSSLFAETLHDFESELEEVETHAVLLLQEIESKDKFRLKKLENYKELKNALSEIECPRFTYTAYTIEHGGEHLLYLVAGKRFSRSVIIGRHFMMRLDGLIADVLNIASSTNGCIDLGKPRKDAAAMFVTSLEPYPSEFHVIQSKLNKVSIYVGTSYATWKVSDGEVSLVELREDA